MPNWKKVIVSGSDALLNSVSGSSFVYSGGDVIAAQNLRSIYSSGDEGGEIFLNKPATNTSITTGVNIDVWRNQLRIWESGGTNRGFYLDMTTGGTGVGTNLASGGGTVTSVSASGTVSGITLGGGPITGAGTLTLSGTISGLTNSNLSGTAGITNANLANSSVTVGSTAISLGGTSTTLAGLSSVTSTSFVGALTGNASTATQTTATVTGTNSADLVYGNMADNDQFRIRVGGTATNAGFVEIATADDGTEPIHVRQYTGVFTSLARTATLLDGSGNTTFPGTVTANGTLLTGNTGTVTSVGGTGTVNGITLTGTVTSTGNLTLGGTLSGIGNAQLTNSSITVGSTAISLGSSATTIAGLSSVTSTTFVGALTGNASTATTAASASSILPNTVTGIVPVPFMSQKTPGVASYLGGDTLLTYNTSTGTLNATTFNGALSGNATTATTATTATSASTQVLTTNANHFLTFVLDNNLGGPASEALGTVGSLTYNPSIGSLNATSITGSHLGNTVGTASYATAASQSGYTMQFVLATTGSNLAASTTYSMGAPVRNQLLVTAGQSRIYVPRPGRVEYAHIYVRTNGQLASAGTSTFSLGKNTAVSEVLGTSTTVGSSANATVVSTAVSMSVVPGDFLEIRWTTPAWATLPTALEANGIIYIENNL